MFGGADVLPLDRRRMAGSRTVGALNCQAALEVLAEEGFTRHRPPTWAGRAARTIHFNTGTGEVLVHTVWPPEQPADAMARRAMDIEGTA